MLERLSNGSIVVRSFGVTDLLELLQIRSLLESEAAAMATGRIPAEPLEGLRTRLQALLDAQTPDEKSDWEVDNALHDLVAAYCGNRNLASMITATRRQVRMCDVERLRSGRCKPGKSTWRSCRACCRAIPPARARRWPPIWRACAAATSTRWDT